MAPHHQQQSQPSATSINSTNQQSDTAIIFPAALYSANAHYLAAREQAAIPPRNNTVTRMDTFPRALYAQNVNGSRILHARELATGVVDVTTAKAPPPITIPENVTAPAATVQVIRFSDTERANANKTSKSTDNADDDDDSDIISDYIGHYGWWQFFWTFLLALFQLPCTFQIFAFVFQVCTTMHIIVSAIFAGVINAFTIV